MKIKKKKKTPNRDLLELIIFFPLLYLNVNIMFNVLVCILHNIRGVIQPFGLANQRSDYFQIYKHSGE